MTTASPSAGGSSSSCGRPSGPRAKRTSTMSSVAPLVSDSGAGSATGDGRRTRAFSLGRRPRRGAAWSHGRDRRAVGRRARRLCDRLVSGAVGLTPTFSGHRVLSSWRCGSDTVCRLTAGQRPGHGADVAASYGCAVSAIGVGDHQLVQLTCLLPMRGHPVFSRIRYSTCCTWRRRLRSRKSSSVSPRSLISFSSVNSGWRCTSAMMARPTPKGHPAAPQCGLRRWLRRLPAPAPTVGQQRSVFSAGEIFRAQRRRLQIDHLRVQDRHQIRTQKQPAQKMLLSAEDAAAR